MFAGDILKLRARRSCRRRGGGRTPHETRWKCQAICALLPFRAQGVAMDLWAPLVGLGRRWLRKQRGRRARCLRGGRGLGSHKRSLDPGRQTPVRLVASTFAGERGRWSSVSPLVGLLRPPPPAPHRTDSARQAHPHADRQRERSLCCRGPRAPRAPLVCRNARRLDPQQLFWASLPRGGRGGDAAPKFLPRRCGAPLPPEMLRGEEGRALAPVHLRLAGGRDAVSSRCVCVCVC